MESGVTKSFACHPPIFGFWISVSKSANSALHFQELRVYGGKYENIFGDNNFEKPDIQSDLFCLEIGMFSLLNFYR